MKALELRKKSKEELQSFLKEKLLEREEASLLIRQKKARNVKGLRGIKKDIARAKTILNQ